LLGLRLGLRLRRLLLLQNPCLLLPVQVRKRKELVHF